MLLRLLPLLFVVGCTHRVALQPVPATQREVTILVPGYRGSFLVDDRGETAWLTPGQALFGGDRALALPFEGQRDFPRWGALQPNGALTGFSVLPFIGYEAYGGFLEFAREALPGFEVFAYDWRRDVRESGALLCARIEALARERGGEVRINLIAHSMGGLVTLECLRGQDTQGWSSTASHVKRLVILGTPFRGSPGIFDDLFLGTRTAMDTRLLTPEALFSFPAAFQLLPTRGDFIEGAPFDLHDPKVWIERGWAVFQDPALRDDAQYHAQLRRLLDAHAAVHRPRAEATPPFGTLVVVGTGRKTTLGFRAAPDGKVNVRAPIPGDGDAAVLVSSAQPPPDLAGAEVMMTRAEHVELLSDREVQARIIAFLRQGGG